MKKWYALYTRNGCENKVSELLNKRKIENYVPINRLIHENDSSQIEYKLIFESFVFVRVEPDKVYAAQNIKDVINIIYWIGKPAEFDDYEIESMQNFLNQHYNIRVEKINIASGHHLTFISDSIKSRSNIKLELPSIGYVLIADTHNFNALLFKQTGKIVELVL